MATVTFETQCWENDYEYILTGDRLKQSIANCNYKFAKRQVIINKVYNRKKVHALAEQCKQDGIIDEYYFAADYIKPALKQFGVKRSSFKGGYYYSRCQYVGLYLAETDYVLHFTTDSWIDQPNNSTWIQEATELMDANPQYACANPSWIISRNGVTFGKEGAKDESTSELDNWYVGYGFSDNCYMVPTKLFKQPIYNEHHPASERYPVYAGQCFEKRVDSYMRNHNLLRLSYKTLWYSHTNFPKKTHVKLLGYWDKFKYKVRQNLW